MGISRNFISHPLAVAALLMAGGASIHKVFAVNAKRNAGDEVAREVTLTFKPFPSTVKTRFDEKNFYVESDGMPDHRMMVGITAWQQQVPLPQPYVGPNAWQFPLVPKVAVKPLSAKDHFFRGAIAIAANGVSIFNPIKNDGQTDTFLAGELDEFGGHCGRADDYHYHIAPLHLQKQIGKGLPIAYALDGYPIYGLTDLDGSTPKDLDKFNGHAGKDGKYHYHSTKSYPYINGGFHGEVSDKGGQVDPQPRAQGVRPAGEPLRGAKINGFEKLSDGSYKVTFTWENKTYNIQYSVAKDGTATFNFIDSDGKTNTQKYVPRPRGRGNG